MIYKNNWAVMDSIVLNKIIEGHKINAFLVINRDGEIIQINKDFYDLFKIDKNVEVLGKSWEVLISSDTVWNNLKKLIHSAMKEKRSFMALSYSNKKKKWMIGKVYVNKVKNKITLYVGEINESLENYKILKNYDMVTMLPNREIYEKHFSLDLNLNSFILVDLKRFHLFHERLGSYVGNKLYLEIINKVQDFTLLNYPLYKVSNSQFLLVVPQVEDEIVVNKLKGILYESIEVDSQSFYINSHIAVYRAKKEDDKKKAIYYVQEALWLAQKKSLPVFYYTKGDTDLNLLVIEHDLKKAIRENQEQFYITYQMQYSIEKKGFCGAEALIRWNHPDLGIISPLVFLGVAQEMNLLVDIDKLVFSKIEKDIKKFQDNGKNFPISMNLSAQTVIDKDFQDLVIKKLEKFQNIINFEITETDKLSLEDSKLFLSELRKKGCMISIDDFGTGYSSFEYIMNCSANCLKIDKKFVTNIEENNTNQTIVENIIKMSNSLNIMVVAEGAETFSEVDVLKRLGCHVIQGFYYAKPFTAEELISGLLK